MKTGSERYLRPMGLALSGRPDGDLFTDFSEADWVAWTELAKREGLAPLLYYTQESSGWPLLVPVQEREALREEYLKAGGSNLLVYRELARVLSAFQVAVPLAPLVLLKGAALATTLYPEFGLRPMTDIDMLLPREHLEEAVDTLRTLGYKDLAPEMTPRLSRETHFQVAMKGGPRDYVIVDLHWRLIGGEGDLRSPMLDWFQDQTHTWRMHDDRGNSPSLSALQLCPTAHLLYLAAHLMLQHGGAKGRLLWVHDIHLLVLKCQQQLEWDELSERAGEYGWSPALEGALGRARALFDTPLPVGFLDRLAADSIPKTRAAVESRALPVQTRGTAAWNRMCSLDWTLRLKVARSVLWPTPEYLRWRYGLRRKWLWPLWYPYRWALLSLECVKTLAKWWWWRFGYTQT